MLFEPFVLQQLSNERKGKPECRSLKKWSGNFSAKWPDEFEK